VTSLFDAPATQIRLSLVSLKTGAKGTLSILSHSHVLTLTRHTNPEDFTLLKATSLVWMTFSDVGKVLLTKTHSNSINILRVRLGDVLRE
jgi:hypothetical protein